MTLITYLTRVHFADGVLEEALVSELEMNRHSRPLLLSSSKHQDSEFAERVYSGLPYHCAAIKYAIKPEQSLTRTISEIVRTVDREVIDVIVAFGSSQAISVAGECCQILLDNHNEWVAGTAKTARTQRSLDFIAVPGVDGLPDLSRPRPRRKNGLSGVLYSGTGPQPSVAIYDPTLIVGECPVQTASAAVNTLSRCVEAYLSENYNPPADGIAYDGILRIVKYMPSNTQKDEILVRREQMAASLEGSLALQKGGGLAQELSDALVVVSGLELDEGALKRLLLPLSFDIVELRGSQDRTQVIRAALGISTEETFDRGWKNLMRNLPLPSSFEAHGLTDQHISQAVAVLVQGRMNSIPDADTLESMMTSLQHNTEQTTA